MEAKEQKPFKVKAVCTTCGKEVPLFRNDKADESNCACDKQDCDIEAVKIRVSGDHAEQDPLLLSEKSTEKSGDSSLNFKPNQPLAISPATESEFFVKPGYKLVAALGEGSMGSAFKVHSESLDSDFVIKKLNPILSENPRTAKRWRLSGSEVIQLSHPNMESIYEVDIAPDGSSYMVTEAVDGEPLAKLIQREGFMEAGDVIEIAKQVLEALAYIHENGILHRGLNPRNIFLAKSKEGKYSIKLTDCGTARAWPNSGRETRFLLSDGKEFGDPRYMSPEQCSGQRLTESADIYSFGCVMYEALGGKPPFSSRNPNQTAVKQLTADIRPLSDRFRDLDIPPDLEAIVMKALQKDPIRRYKSVKEMLRDLEKAGTQKGPVKPPAAIHRVELPDWMKGELDLRKIIILVALTAILAAVCGMIYSATYHREHPTISPEEISAPFQSARIGRSFSENYESASLTPLRQTDVFDNDGNKVASLDCRSFSEAINLMMARHDDLQNLDCHATSLHLQSLTPQLFQNSNFAMSNLSACRLPGASFKNASFIDAKLFSSTFDNADFSHCNANRANLTMNQFSRAWLVSSDFSRARFVRNNFSDVHARTAKFIHSIFNGDNMVRADLTEAILSDAQLTNVTASQTNFVKANLDRITLIQSHFPDCNFQQASMIDARMTGINFARGNFRESSLKNADLSFAYLCNSDFSHSNLCGANLSNANLSGCDFSNADLSFADLTNADLTGAVLEGADITGAKLKFDQPADAKSRLELLKKAIGGEKLNLEKRSRAL